MSLLDSIQNVLHTSWKITKYIIIAVVGYVIFSSTYFVIAPSERWLKMTLGTLNDTVYGEWIHWKIPLLDTIRYADLHIDRADGDARSASKDLQNVETKISVNYQINESSILLLFRTVWVEHSKLEDTLLAPAIQESVKAATAKYTAEELITKRELVRTDIENALKDKIVKYGVNIVQVNIVNFEFSKSFDASIEAKVKAEQDALAQKNKLEQVKYEAQQKIESAKAEAETIRIQAEAIQKQGGAEYIQLKWIEKWSGQLPTTSLGTSMIPNIFLNNSK